MGCPVSTRRLQTLASTMADWAAAVRQSFRRPLFDIPAPDEHPRFAHHRGRIANGQACETRLPNSGSKIFQGRSPEQAIGISLQIIAFGPRPDRSSRLSSRPAIAHAWVSDVSFRVPPRQNVTDDTPLRLDVAAKLSFPDGSIGQSSLRREASRGRLRVWRVAGKDMTTLREIRRMLDRCLVSDCRPGSGSGHPITTEGPSGLSSTGADSTALAAARMRVKTLKEGSSNT